MNMIQINDVHKSFDVEVLKGITLEVNQGDVVAVIGSSGSGKSTLLRCLIDLEKVDSGSVLIEGDPLVENGIYAKKTDIQKLI